MTRRLSSIVLPLAAACSVPAHAETVDKAIAAIYAPYGEVEPDWEAFQSRQPYSGATVGLIDEWLSGLPEDEVTDLSSFDWFCECQDWDAAVFKLDIQPHGEPVDGRIDIVAWIELGWDETREHRFAMVEEGGEWKIDDHFSESFPDGLKAALREAIVNPWPE